MPCGLREREGVRAGINAVCEGERTGQLTIVLDIHDAVDVETGGGAADQQAIQNAPKRRPTHLTVFPLTVLISLLKQYVYLPSDSAVNE